jgi:hypothetical protein
MASQDSPSFMSTWYTLLLVLLLLIQEHSVAASAAAAQGFWAHNLIGHDSQVSRKSMLALCISIVLHHVSLLLPLQPKPSPKTTPFLSFSISSPPPSRYRVSHRALQPVERQQQMIRECFTLISKRSDRVCNFLEDVGAWSKDTKLVRQRRVLLFYACGY